MTDNLLIMSSKSKARYTRMQLKSRQFKDQRLCPTDMETLYLKNMNPKLVSIFHRGVVNSVPIFSSKDQADGRTICRHMNDIAF